MRRFWLAAVFGLVASLLLVGAARANVLVFERPILSVAHLVEQQSALPECLSDENGPGCVVNPTGCPWDIDDRVVWWALPATLDGSVSFSQCLIRDDTHRMLGGLVHSKSPDLVVTIDYQPVNVSFTLTRVAVDRAYEYRGCVFGPRYSDPSLGQTIPGSNGGWGVPTTVTVTTTNTGRSTRNVDAQFESGVSSDERRAHYCVGTEGPVFSRNGALWQTAL